MCFNIKHPYLSDRALLFNILLLSSHLNTNVESQKVLKLYAYSIILNTRISVVILKHTSTTTYKLLNSAMYDYCQHPANRVALIFRVTVYSRRLATSQQFVLKDRRPLTLGVVKGRTSKCSDEGKVGKQSIDEPKVLVFSSRQTHKSLERLYLLSRLQICS